MKAREEAVIQGKNYRFTVLTPYMIRMEYSGAGEFVDGKTQQIVNRKFAIPEFRVEETEKELQIITTALRVTYNKREFSPEGLKINISGNYPGISPVWHFGDIGEDLKGTARTLDEADGEIPLESGILSEQGWTLLDDKGTMTLEEDGWIALRKDPQAEDLYFLGYGRNYLQCLKDFHVLTGKVPLLPKYALGNWWSRYYQYSEKTYLELMERFEQEEIPFTVSVIDMDWHITDINEKYGTGWTGYTWNRELFPDPERFLQKLHEKGLKVTLNVHPADGVRAFEDCYEPFAEYMGVDKNAEEPIPFQPGNKKFMKGYFEYVHHPLEDSGVDFWWIDWQQGTNSGIEGLDPLWMLNHYHYEDSKRNGKRGLIFSRYAGPGSHRYPVGFSGDSVITWKSLDFQPYFTATASNIGYGWWSHDIGGHMNGIKDDELAVRWLQFGVFSPIMRLHSTNNEFNGKEPWRYNEIAERIMKKYLRLRHQMIPYLNVMNLRANQEGIPLIQPMYYQHPMESSAYVVPNEYYFGEKLIVCPITAPREKHTGMGRFAAWLPEGMWIDFFTGMTYTGGRHIDLYRDIENIPVLAKAGNIVPLDGRKTGNAVSNSEQLEIHVFTGDSGEFILWEDDADVPEFEEKLWAKTKMEYVHGESSYFKIYPAKGNRKVLPEKRTYRICLAGVDKHVSCKVMLSEKKIDQPVYEYQAETGFLWITVPEAAIDEEIFIQLEHGEKRKNEVVDRVYKFLDRAEIEFNLKTKIMNTVRKLEQGTSAIYVMGELSTFQLQDEVLGVITEMITA